MKVVLTACAYLSVLTTFGIILVLIFETLRFFGKVSIVEFLTSTEWSASFSGAQAHYGILPLVCGTLLPPSRSSPASRPSCTATSP